MAVMIDKLAGINDAIQAKLKQKGILNNEQFLEASLTPALRKELAAYCEVTPRDILELANRADLSRLNGVAGVYADLLERAGVDTVKELATRRPDNLHKKLMETNEAQKITRNPPLEEQVQSWVEQAKALPKTLIY